MIRLPAFVAALATGAVCLVGLGLPAGSSATTTTFEYTGAPQLFTLPASTNKILVHALGAEGGSYDDISGGLGGEAIVPLAFASGGQSLQINVGGSGQDGTHSVDLDCPSGCAGGFNGGGNGGPPGNFLLGAGGGGASDLRVGGFQLSDRRVVAGGGGGGAAVCGGGSGGGTNGSSAPCDDDQGGYGGSQTTPGGGSGEQAPGFGYPGSFGSGGTGGSGIPDNPRGDPGEPSGGGGGGGWYGGSGGVGGTDTGIGTGGGGGGGSGYAYAGAGTLNSGVRQGNGEVSITWATADDLALQSSASTLTVGDPVNLTITFDLPSPPDQMIAELWGPQDPTCQGTTSYGPAFSDGITTNSNGIYKTLDFRPTEPGTYHWTAGFNETDEWDTTGTPCAADQQVVRVLPPVPTGLTATPASPSNVNAPSISGSAYPGTTVALFSTAACSGTPMATGTAAAFASPGLPVTVADNSTTSIRAVATGGGLSSPCPASALNYVEDSVIPSVSIDSKPSTVSNSASAAFTYSSNKSGVTFACRLDSQEFVPCPENGVTYPGLADGFHSFAVRATDDAGNDSVVDSYSWTVDADLPEVTLTAKPAAFTSSTAAAFTYSSSEGGSSFMCSLDGQNFSYCQPSGVSFSGLTEGAHTFNVRATDPAGNPGLVTTWSWTIDTTIPLTTITSSPPAASTSASASFGYSSTETGSSYQCQLDTQSFSPCPATGMTYSSLANGPHTFSVRATDLAGNTGPAATNTWTIELPQADIGRVAAAGPARVGKGKPVMFNVKITNSGNAAASGVRVQLTGRGAKAKGSAGQIAAGKTERIAVKFRPGSAGKVGLTFRVTSKNAGSKIARKTITVRG